MKIVDKFPERICKSQSFWDTLLDGQCRELESGKDFTCKPNSFAQRCYKMAKERGVKIRVLVQGKSTFIQRKDS